MHKFLKNVPYILTICFILSGCCVIDESIQPEFRPCCCAVCESQTPDVEITPTSTPKPPPRGKPKKYAVLISAYEVNNQDSDEDGIRDGENVKHHAAFWYDLVLQYKMLIKSGFDHNNIKVLYGRGSAFDTIYPEYDLRRLYPTHQITYNAVTKDNIERIFDELKLTVTKDDHLYIWWMGHGHASGPDNCGLSLFIGYTDENVTTINDDLLHEYINRIPTCLKRIIAVMACHSGGIIDNMAIAGEGTIGGTVTLASSGCEQNSYDTLSSCDVYHAEFNYTLTTALLKENSCGSTTVCRKGHLLDGNEDGYVSLEEAHEFNKCEMIMSNPMMGDNDGIRHWPF